MIRLAMVGCGDISERFFRQAAARDDVRFVATCARRRENAERKGREHGITEWFDDFEQMYDAVRPDGVVITTPHSLHAAPSIAASRRGIHVLNEKPMATSFEDCRAMVEAARASGSILMCLPFDHHPAFLTALEYLNETTLGKWTGGEAVLLIPGPPRDNWYYDRSIAHGGAMLDCMVYPVSRLISLLGPARRVTGRVNTLIPHRIVGEGKRINSDVDDNATLLIEWEHAVGNFLHPQRHDRVRAQGHALALRRAGDPPRSAGCASGRRADPLAGLLGLLSHAGRAGDAEREHDRPLRRVHPDRHPSQVRG